MTGNLVVLDVGKTRSKLSVWTPHGELVETRERSNRRCSSAGRLVLDTSGIEEWLAETLRDFGRAHEIGGIIPVAHGAAAALIRNGRLAVPPADYEFPVPLKVRQAYELQRDPFKWTGSPALPDGLNLGVQLHRLEQLHPELFDEATQVVTWPQYWSWLLSGVAATEVTSLGCHTDLWNPWSGRPSSLAERRGWAKLLAPLRFGAEPLGSLKKDWVYRTGLPPSVEVYCGVHDSNAALLAARAHSELADNDATVLSTGTWFVAMRSLGHGGALNPRVLPSGRDVLVNVDPKNRPVPSARFMGGREIQLLTALASRQIEIVSDQDLILRAASAVIREGRMALPTVAPGCGPYPDGRGEWISKPDEALQLRAAVSLYAALVTDAMLELIAARNTLLIEGRFAAAQLFVRAVANLRPELRVYASTSRADVARGALRLVYPRTPVRDTLQAVQPLDADLGKYRTRWRAAAESALARA